MNRMLQFGLSVLFSVMAISVLTNPVIAAGTTSKNVTQEIMISFKQNLYTESGYEAACVATSLGMLFTNNGANVTLFVTLDGVELANATSMTYVDAYAALIGKWSCNTSTGSKSLSELIKGFASAGGSIMICPICWGSRFGMESTDFADGVFMPDSATLADRFLKADKVIDF